VKPTADSLNCYAYHLEIPTRWADNDAYGHVNNAVYYFYFDTVVNTWTIGLVVETGCSYFAPLRFPETITAGLRAAKIGGSSVRYEIALFGEGQTVAAAQGHFIHVYVDEKTRAATPISDRMRKTLGDIMK